MTVKTMQTEAVKALLHKVAGFDNNEGNPRAKEIVARLVTDIFQMVEDLDVTPEEFWHGVNYLNELGSNMEAVLLAPGLGFDHFLDIREDAKDEQMGLLGGTPRTIEGPLFVEGAPKDQTVTRMDDGNTPGQGMWLHGQVTDETGAPVAGAVVDLWHADKKGAYSYFDTTQSDFNLRRKVVTDENGYYYARSIVPNGYGCPPGGSTMKVLDLLGRHGNRPAHIHFFAAKSGYKHLTTQINLAGDKYTFDDFAFATRDELVVEATSVSDAAKIAEHGFDGEYLDVEFNLSIIKTDKEELADKHVRARAAV
ncbi:catechol 1,2-dioxygenase [Marinomonas mediterranea]|jgi:catechol 1,2-dioxygenase, proteobacterial|uniref:catechol 1,2-dioxygenase n=1 Tax=Marinomonas mediterranea (strain ATCC 700492 / JCM 21426 / NBRC 103028 / MMB-1) TaxID=717774 RepID=F2JV83_MARM1|nr:catechol 1,2-dioxygenase [Marinomonas mediterranea]ADZ92841.1 catechol 1,2-dioxygenase [Marinomonas mediterranea MMB-1]WCN18863.1 catechol 1,2-dioxygenase [Marinomonas mediterranea MMB-1]